MCTVTWLRSFGAYDLFFNRDERRSRKPALPPTIHRLNGVDFVAPVDGEAGGTWLAVNESGLTLAMLNGYAAEELAEPVDGYTSRGLLATSLIDSRSAGELVRRLRAKRLSLFRSFVLVAIDDRTGPWIVDWVHGSLRIDEDATSVAGRMPLVSSAFRPAEVRRRRSASFRARAARSYDEAVRRHREFHFSHEPERGACSPCMHRPEAKTVSFSRVLVGAGSIALHYLAGSPCRAAGEPVCVELTRRLRESEP